MFLRNITKMKNIFAVRQQYLFAKETILVPSMGDSITEGTVLEYNVKVGEMVEQDQLMAVLETDKINVDIKSSKAGVVTKFYSELNDTVEVGKPFYDIDDEGTATSKGEAKQEAPKEAPAAQQTTQQQAPPVQQAPPTQQKSTPPPPKEAPKVVTPPQISTNFSREERVVPLSKMRQTISKRLKAAQNEYALLTTFQEVDMSAVMEMRAKHQEQFVKKNGIKLGFMSFFLKASAMLLQQQPVINADNNILYRDYIDISVAVATPKGLLVPVVRNVESLSFAQIEHTLVDLANKGKNNQISMPEMTGGTFTISNGGVFGSMMGTPIVNPPQSAILGMHSIVNRAVVRGDQIVARPMMYLALTYDHRLIDGREAATFLKQLQQTLENPEKIMLQL